jgi:hypothetical protein
MKNKMIILSVVLSFLVGSCFLFLIERKKTDENYQKNWWSVYFTDPKSESLNFVIENHSDKNDFVWELSDGQNKSLKKDRLKIEKGGKKTINLPTDLPSQGKMIITVTDTVSHQKQVYKNL